MSKNCPYKIPFLILTLLAVTCGLAVAQVAGFSGSAGWTLNSANATGYNSNTGPATGTNSSPTLTASTAQLLPNQAFSAHGASGAASSIFYNTAQSVGSFTASFTYQATGGGGSNIGDAVAFVIQSNSLTAIGSQGGSGATAIPTSFATAFSYNSATPGNDFVIDGVGPVYSATGSLNLANNQDPILVTLKYNTVTLFETITDMVTGKTYSTFKNVDITAVVGGQTAFIGFTAGSSASFAGVTISNFTFTPVAVPGIQFIPKPIVPNGWGACVAPNGYGGDYYQQTGVYGDYYFSPSQQAQFVQSGMTLIRADLTWNNVEFSQGNYNWSYYDGLVNNLAGTGVNVMFILDYTNAIYSGNVYQQPALGGYANFAAAAAKHFQGKNVLYEIWNEPNFAYGFTGSQYSTIAIATEQAMRAANPNVTIIGPAEGELDPVWRESMLSTGGGVSLNAYSFHPYVTPPESALTSSGYQGGFPGVTADLETYPPSNGIPLPMMASESGTGGDTLQHQASYYTRIYLTDQLYGLVLNTIYKYQDGTPADNNPANNDYGLIYANNTPKPAFTAVQNLISSLRGYEQIGSINTGNSSLYDSVYQKGTALSEAIWSTNSPNDSALPYIRVIPAGSAEYTQKLNAVYANSPAVIAPASYTTQFTVTSPNAAANGIPLGTPFPVTVTALDEYNNVSTSYNGTVHFTSTDPAAVLPADVSLTNGVSTFNVTIKSEGYQYVTATDTEIPSITNAFLGTSSVPGYTIGATAEPLTVNAGTSGLETFSISFQGGLSQTVNFTVSGVPAGVTATLSSNSLSTNGNDAVTITASRTASFGTYPITVTGSDGSSTQSFTFPLTIGPGNSLPTGGYLATGQYIVSPSGNCFLIQQSNGTLALYSGSGPSNQGAQLWSSGATGSGTSFYTVMQSDGNLVTYAAAGPASGGYFVWNSGTYTGSNYTLNLLDSQVAQIRSGTTVIWQEPATGTSTFTVTPTLITMTVDQGSNGLNTLAVSAFSGYSGNVALTISGAPSGVTATLSPTSISTSGNSTLSVAVSATASQGTSSLLVTAVSGATTHVLTIPLIIGPGSRLANNTYLSTNQYITSPSGNCYLKAQSDGNVVLYNGSPSNSGSPIWYSNVLGSGGQFYLSMQTDGNLIMNPGTGPTNSTGSAIWATGTYTGAVGAYYTLNVLDSKEVQILNGSTVIWQEPGSASAGVGVLLSDSVSAVPVNEGTSETSTVTLNYGSGSTGTTQLSVSNLPTGVTASFSQSSFTGSGTSNLTLTLSPTAATGSFVISINAVNGSATTSLNLPVIIGSGSTLENNSFLADGQYLVSPSGTYYLVQQSSGNLALYSGSAPSSNPGTPIWQSYGNAGGGSSYTFMQTDGNLVTYTGSGPGNGGSFVWNSGIATGPNSSTAYTLSVTDDGLIQIMSGTTVVWEEPADLTTLSSVASVQMHAGTPFGIPLPLTGAEGVEGRIVNGSLKLVFTFDQAITAGTAEVTAGSAEISGSPAFSGNTMTVYLTGVADAQNVTVSLTNLNEDTDATGVVTFGVLAGDVNGDGVVNILDLGQMRLHTAQPVTAQNCQYDINEDDAINILDLGQGRLRTGRSIP